MNELTEEQENKINNSYRASGNCICDICSKKYYDHKDYEPSKLTHWQGECWLQELCNGDLVKL